MQPRNAIARKCHITLHHITYHVARRHVTSDVSSQVDSPPLPYHSSTATATIYRHDSPKQASRLQVTAGKPHSAGSPEIPFSHLACGPACTSASASVWRRSATRGRRPCRPLRVSPLLRARGVGVVAAGAAAGGWNLDLVKGKMRVSGAYAGVRRFGFFSGSLMLMDWFC